jgi:glycerophosphoryl diester phosphodiesterase
MTLVIAHRGASRAHPPGNTLAAFRSARALGADWVELDVRRTADGALAVHHDAHLEDGRAIVAVLADDLPDEVPLLADALAACDGLGVNVEIKNAPGEPDFDEQRTVAGQVLASVDGAERARHLVTSFDPFTLARVRELDPAVPIGLLAFDLQDPTPTVERAVELGCVALNPWDPYVTEGLVARCRSAGLDVNVWTVNDTDRMKEMLELGVTGIITDTPDVLRALVDGG